MGIAEFGHGKAGLEVDMAAYEGILRAFDWRREVGEVS